MAINDFDLFTLEEVDAIKARYLALLQAGQTIFSYTSEGTSVSKGMSMPMADVLQKLIYWYKRHQPEIYGKIHNKTTSVFTQPI